MQFDATFNNISVLLVAEAGVPGENHRAVAVDFEFDIGSQEGVLDTTFVLKFVYKIQKVFVFSIYEKKV